MATGIVLCAISAVLWFAAMRHITLGHAGVACSMLTLIALAVIGTTIIGKRLAAR